MENRVIKELNAELGSNLEDISKSKTLVEQCVNQLNAIEEKLTITSQNSSTIIKATLEGSQNVLNLVNETFEEANYYENKISKVIDKYKNIHENISTNLQKINDLEHLVEYFFILRDIQDISSELSNCIHSKDEQKIVNFFLSLSGSPDSNDSVMGRLKDVDAPHMKLYARRMALYWYDVIKDRLSSDFEAILKTIKWPNLGHLLEETFNPTKEVINKLQTLAEYLFLVQLPGYDRFMYVKLSPSIVCPPISTPIQLLVKPFQVRFEYHFMSSRQTNRPDKPEYYFTQILSWAKDNHHFVSEIFQAPANRACACDNIRLEFIRGLVQLTIEKLLQDIEEISFDEQLFAHLIDEILSFEQDLKSTLSYPNTLPSAVNVLTQPFFFTKWLSIEEKFTSDKIDLILSDENMPWSMLDSFGFTNITSPHTALTIEAKEELDLDEIKIPKCSDQFVRLLEAMKERYCILPQPSHQLQFLELQIELIDGFRRRLVQLYNTATVNTLNILNAVYYIICVLREWGENVHYLHLHAALQGPTADEVTSVFDKSIHELDHWQNKLIKHLSSKLVDEIKAKSMPYRHDNWVSMPKQNPNESFVISPSSSEMFQLLITVLHDLETALSTAIFSSILRRIAKKLDDYFIDSMIMNTKFSEGGAGQFKYDVSRNLVPLFGQYSRRPGLLFKNLNDSCTLLSLPFGTALLLHQTLKAGNKTTNAEELENMKEALKEVGIVSLPITLAVDVLERRNDVYF
ncbi:CLUMA_CG008920, isoform A [Clunio marinus]|uniref:CLUMA_CG008920, isoform A n=1 Tax=Clunio marinus TaxID=568069 RepID=A0A1J1I5I9_9DIPT|nr:CLUMA_CG008920, isoform A [Clunio marinus]